MASNSPTREDPLAAGASELIGGPMGRHANGRWLSWWTPLRIALGITVLVCVGGYLQKSVCLTHPYTNEYQYTRLCYTDTYVLYTNEDLNAQTNAKGQTVVPVPYRDHPVEYPPVIGGLMWVAAEVTSYVHGHSADPGGARATTFFNVTALGLALLALISTWTLAKLVGRTREWDVLMVAASPVLFMHAFTNWDLAAVALTGLGLWAWSRSAPMLAGVALGLGVATKLYPALVLLALLMLCARARQWYPALRSIAGALIGLVVAYLPAVLISKSFEFPSTSCPAGHPLAGWRWFFSLSQTRGADWGSPWLILRQWFGNDAVGRALAKQATCAAAPTTLNIVSSFSVLLVIIAVGLLVASAPWRPRVGQVAFLLVAGFVMLNKVDSPQYALWLVPLAVLARPKWLSILVWQVTEVLLGAANLYTLISLDHSDQGLPMDTYFLFIILRDLVLAGLMALVVRDVVRPQLDVIRQDGVDDPVGGVLVAAVAS